MEEIFPQTVKVLFAEAACLAQILQLNAKQFKGRPDPDFEVAKNWNLLKEKLIGGIFCAQTDGFPRPPSPCIPVLGIGED